MKFTDELKSTDVIGKKIFLRVDFNVDINKETKKIDDFRIRSHREMIGDLLEKGAKIALVSHINDAKSFQDIFDQIKNAVGQSVELILLSEYDNLATHLDEHQLIMLDNIRQDSREEKNDPEFAQQLTKGFDIYVNDAFATMHRQHASIVGVPRHLPSYAGLLVKKELDHLLFALNAPIKGKVLVLGGAKLSTKLPVIKNFMDKTEKILVGGAIANDFFKAQGMRVGSSTVDDSVVEGIGDSKIVLPEDMIITDDTQGNGRVTYSETIGNIEENEAIVDIGFKTMNTFSDIISRSSLVIWNGPMGLSEVSNFAEGSYAIGNAVADASKSIIGGGDTVALVRSQNLLDKFGFVSTGGGAMLVFLSGERLPGLEALGYY